MRTCPVAAVILLLVLTGFTPAEAKRCVGPEGVTGTAACGPGTPDEDCTNLANAGDVKCDDAAAFQAIPASASFHAQAEHCIPFGASASAADPTASPTGGSGAYAGLPVGIHAFTSGWACHGLTTNSYDVHVLAQGAGDLWVQVVTPPFLPFIPPNNRDAGRIAGEASSWSWQPIGRYDTIEGWNDKINQSPIRAISITTGDILILQAESDVKLDCLWATPTSAPEIATRGCPDGGGEVPTVANIVLKELGANVENANGTEDAYWGQANALALQGLDTGLTATNPLIRLAWDDSANRMLLLAKMTKAGLISPATAADDPNILNGTHVELNFRLTDLVRVRDENTYKIACDLNGFVYDRNEAGGASNPTYDLTNVDCGVSYAANVMIIELAFDLPQTVAAEDFFLLDGALFEQVTGAPAVYQVFFTPSGSTNNLAAWGMGKFVATAMDTPADTTAPTADLSCTPDITTVSCTLVANESGTCKRGIDTTINADVATVATPSGSTLGSPPTCSFSVTGLTAELTLDVKACVTDAAGNTGCDALTTTTLAAGGPGGGTGETFYISTTGSGSACTSGAPCANLQAVKALAAFGPGDTVLWKNGTYLNSAAETINYDCATNPSKFNGTAALPITFAAENERLAVFSTSNWSTYPIWVKNCHYIRIEGFDAVGANYSSGLTEGGVVTIDTSSHMTVRKNLVRHNNQCMNGSILHLKDTTDSLVEDNEIYDFHRNGAAGNVRTVWRRNYMNSRGATNPACYIVTTGDTHPKTTGDDGYIAYGGLASDSIWEDNASEGNEGGHAHQCSAPHRRLKMFGSILLKNKNGVLSKARGVGSDKTCGEVLIENTIAAGNWSTQLYLRALISVTVRNVSLFGASLGIGQSTTGLLFDSPNDEYGTKNYQLTMENIITTGHSGSGISVEDPITNNQTGNVFSWTGNYIRSWANTPNFNGSVGGSGALGNPNGTLTNTSTTSPGLPGAATDIHVCIPRNNAALANAGAGGRDIGANAIYRYTNGVLSTSAPRWIQTKPASCPANSSGWYPYGMGECKAGVNTAAGNYWDIADRLGITTAKLNACALDGSY